MSEHGAYVFVRDNISSIVNPDQWARALEYVHLLRTVQKRTWCDIAALLTCDNPFNIVTKG